jgi:hypothetical protein
MKGTGQYNPDFKEKALALKEQWGWCCERCGHPHDPGAGYALTIIFFNEQMTLTPAQVVSKIVMGSPPVADQFSDNTHKLLYYRWEPNQQEVVPQPRLM